MKTLLTIGGTFLACIILFTQCNNPQRAQNEWAEERAELKAEVNETIDNIDAKIQETKSKMADASDDMKRKWEASKDNLERTKENLEDRLEEIDDSTESNWEEFEDTVEDGLDNAKRDLKAFGEEFKDFFKNEA
ncbi:apolipoprotein A1/A4/E family protein [Marinoscillum pacificum]|uniref:apolipoprotein A1/A4/E family protein n=1 Tax=Marinoscillum pacificum TaxID=392723 RepID=UPI0021589977|nr:apolipoprotein A1/A4/E family protein [Marinoscillum pacificum]